MQQEQGQPTDLSVINRRVFLAPALPREQGKKHDADVKKLLPTLDIGSHINARLQLLPEAAAERRL
jgi:tripartite-type tricarboxylate transporter receptor subunit TctC